jgi:hypothetical protein
MEFLIALWVLIGSLLVGIIGNIFAHDFCAITPKICRRLIGLAVRILPEKDRAERTDEWLADLNVSIPAIPIGRSRRSRSPIPI